MYYTTAFLRDHQSIFKWTKNSSILDIRVAPYAHESPGFVVHPAIRYYLVEDPCVQVSIDWFMDEINVHTAWLRYEPLRIHF